MPVSAAGRAGLAISATVVDAPGRRATVTQREALPDPRAEPLFEPERADENSTALSWSLTGIPTVPLSVMVVCGIAVSPRAAE